jgi:hypothetical protein
MTPSLEVSIAEISKDIKYIIKRLEENTARFEVIEGQIAEHEKHINRLYGAIALCAFIIPIILKYFIGV